MYKTVILPARISINMTNKKIDNRRKTVRYEIFTGTKVDNCKKSWYNTVNVFPDRQKFGRTNKTRFCKLRQNNMQNSGLLSYTYRKQKQKYERSKEGYGQFHRIRIYRLNF